MRWKCHRGFGLLVWRIYSGCYIDLISRCYVDERAERGERRVVSGVVGHVAEFDGEGLMCCIDDLFSGGGS